MREIHRAEKKTASLYITYEIILLQLYNILLNISEGNSRISKNAAKCCTLLKSLNASKYEILISRSKGLITRNIRNEFSLCIV